MRAPDALEVRAITSFFTTDSDSDHFCGLGARATLAEVRRRFGDDLDVGSSSTIVRGHEIRVTSARKTSPLVLGSTTYTCHVEVLLPDDPEIAFPHVDVRLVRHPCVQTELKAAVAELKTFFGAMYGKSLRFQRAGVPGEVWLHAFARAKPDPIAKLEPSAGMRGRSSPLR